MTHLTESVVEHATLAWLEAGGVRIAHGPDIAPLPDWQADDMPAAERSDYGGVVLARRLPDLLPPHFISGELRVKEAEEFFQERWL
jgi:type I restriction enzyme, R subunit